MSNTFGPGWREVVNVPMSDLRPGDYIADEQLVPEGAMRIFTVKRREVPLPPLPTDSWSVVRFYGGHFNPVGTVMILDDSGTWTALYDNSVRWNRGDKMKYDRFEVLS